MGDSMTATVEVLTAEVRVLMVGSRQVTLSVFNQLDWVGWEDLIPFGRVQPRDPGYWIVGRHKKTGALVKARAIMLTQSPPITASELVREAFRADYRSQRDEALRLPLIVLAGLR